MKCYLQGFRIHCILGESRPVTKRCQYIETVSKYTLANVSDRDNECHLNSWHYRSLPQLSWLKHGPDHVKLTLMKAILVIFGNFRLLTKFNNHAGSSARDIKGVCFEPPQRLRREVSEKSWVFIRSSKPNSGLLIS